jgi:hypothetical protein
MSLLWSRAASQSFRSIASGGTPQRIRMAFSARIPAVTSGGSCWPIFSFSCSTKRLFSSFGETWAKRLAVFCRHFSIDNEAGCKAGFSLALASQCRRKSLNWSSWAAARPIRW